MNWLAGALRSKTMWVNVITLGLHFAKPYLGISTLPDVSPDLLALVNIILRLVTTKSIPAKATS